MIYNSLTESANLGLTITDIANELDISRNTVYKYLHELEDDDKIYDKQVGRYKLYYSKEVPLLREYKEGITSFIKELLANMKRTFPNQEALFKSFGMSIADQLKIPFTEEGRDFLKKFKGRNDVELLDSIEEILPYFNFLQDKMKISNIELKRNEKRAVITFANSRMLEKSDDYIYYFYIMVGLIEKKLSSVLQKEVRFDIMNYEVFEKKEDSYIKISFDVQILLPEMEIEGINDTALPEKDIVDVDLIKTYIEPISFAYIIYGVILKKKILFLLDNSFLKNHLRNLIEFTFKDSFDYNILVESFENYIKNKESYEEALILGEKKVIKHIQTKTFREKELRIEQDIVKKFMGKPQRSSSLICLKEEIQKAYILAKELVKKISKKEKGEDQKFDVKQLFRDLEEKHDITLALPYIYFLMEIVESYFEKEVSEVWKFFLYRLR
jgi:predicted transcriptional regulator